MPAIKCVAALSWIAMTVIAVGAQRAHADPAGVQRPGGTGTEFQITAAAGYRRDTLDWTSSAGITLSGSALSVRSTLEWDDLEIYQLALQAKMRWPDRLAVKGALGYGWILDGDNQDSDFITTGGVTTEFSRSNNATEDDNVWEAAVAIGYPFRLPGALTWDITPLVGFAYHRQNLLITDGNQTIPAKGPFEGLESSYETRWYGPTVGLDLGFKTRPQPGLIRQLEVYGAFVCQRLWYEAEADWNLRSDLAHPKSFEHESDGFGFDLDVGLNLFFKERWAVNLNYAYRHFSAENGDDTIFFADGTRTTIDLDEVNWSSSAISAGITLQF